MRSIIAVERHRVNNGSVLHLILHKLCVSESQIVRSLYSSALAYIKQAALRVRCYFKEDNSQITLGGAVENIALFRRFIMNKLKQCVCGAPNQKVKLKKAGWNDDYRHRVFFVLWITVCSCPVTSRYTAKA